MHSFQPALAVIMMQQMKFLMQMKLVLVGVILLLKRLQLVGAEDEEHQAHHLVEGLQGRPLLPLVAQEDHRNQDISVIMMMRTKIQMMQMTTDIRRGVEVVGEAGGEGEALPPQPGVAEVAPGLVASQRSESELLREQLLVVARGMTLVVVRLVDAGAALGLLARVSSVSSRATCHRHAQTVSVWTHIDTYTCTSCEIMNVHNCNTSVYFCNTFVGQLLCGWPWLVLCHRCGQRCEQTTRAWPPA